MAPLSTELSQQEHWGRLPFPTPGALPNAGMELKPLALVHWQVGSLPLHLLGSPHRELHRRCWLWQQVCEGMTHTDESTSKVAHSQAWHAGDGRWVCTSSQAHSAPTQHGNSLPPEDAIPQRGTGATSPLLTSSGELHSVVSTISN